MYQKKIKNSYFLRFVFFKGKCKQLKFIHLIKRKKYRELNYYTTATTNNNKTIIKRKKKKIFIYLKKKIRKKNTRLNYYCCRFTKNSMLPSPQPPQLTKKNLTISNVKSENGIIFISLKKLRRLVYMKKILIFSFSSL